MDIRFKSKKQQRRFNDGKPVLTNKQYRKVLDGNKIDSSGKWNKKKAA